MINECTAPAGANDTARLCAELDELEATAWERVGGPSPAERERMTELECAIASGPAEPLWVAARLARGVLNGWRSELLDPLANAVLAYNRFGLRCDRVMTR